jgi:phosphoribosylaminoimidazolecarboxamide formyltransferase/IMP cyclohydrolase
MKVAIISTYDKTNIELFGKFLLDKSFKIYSSGGTYKHLESSFKKMGITNLDNLQEISSLTEFPEMLNGRVKTLHPKIYGGILAKRNDENSMLELNTHNIPSIDMVIVNLYPFEEMLKKTDEEEILIENIDIGGHTLIRAAAKNYKDVLVVTNPNDYQHIQDNFINLDYKHFAKKAYEYVTKYDMAISSYFNPDIIYRQYKKEFNLKYGLNPQQKSAGIYNNSIQLNIPFKILNGNPGYINFMDAVYGWNLVSELKQILNLPATASYKHTSPAGVGLPILLNDVLRQAYFVSDKTLTPIALSYIRARNSDPLCSFGDFIAINDIVDVCTANLLSSDVSDGIIALGYEIEAFEILKKKKKGTYVILQGNYDPLNNNTEIRELHGITLIQEKNKKITDHNTLKNIVTNNKNLTDQAIIDLILANTTTKYTQSNTIVAAKDGQVIGVGAGQQSRIDCIKLVKRKVINWYLRQNIQCLDLIKLFKNGTHKQIKINAIIRYIENDFTEIEYKEWIELFNKKPDSLIKNDDFIKQLDNISLASDAFMPFRDNIDVSSQFGVKFIVQPGGSIADNEIIKACNDYDMIMCVTGSDMRMFLH